MFGLKRSHKADFNVPPSYKDKRLAPKKMKEAGC